MDEAQIRKELSLRIKAYRKSIKLSQDEFGAKIGFEQKNVSRLESGNSIPDTKTICKLIKSGMDPQYLFEFLQSDAPKYSSKDFEIVNLLINLNDETKDYFKHFLESIHNNP